jgi:hypothetical protein
VQAGHVQAKLAEGLLFEGYVEAADRPVIAGVRHGLAELNVKVGAATRAVGDGAALNLGEHAAQQGIVVADDDHAVERDAIHEVEKSALDVAHVAIAVHVFAIDVGDDRENGREFEE